MLNSSIQKNALKYFTLFFLLFLIIFTSNAYAQLKVIYPNVNGEGMDSFGYSVLKLALEKSGREFELTLNTFDVNNARIRILIKQKKISISDFGTSVDFEQEFLPIYFPIDLGLNGWRIFLIHKKNRNKFRKISTLKDLLLRIIWKLCSPVLTESISKSSLFRAPEIAFFHSISYCLSPNLAVYIRKHLIDSLIF